ncbi:MAG: flagellar basal body rod protein FlgC [Candidatus Eisenbacteria sp.]|nr:flagellar basal body rod protein FlgC [Candidatus Eisenbacteria bacterium]
MKVDYLSGMNTSASALTAYRRWMNTVSENLANAQTTKTPDGGPYRRQQMVFESIQPGTTATRAGARTVQDPVRTHPAHLTGPARGGAAAAEEAPTVSGRIVPDVQTPLNKVYDPSHPDADEDGWVEYPNINPVTEMVNLILASRAYEANVAALAAEQRIQEMALSIGKA